MYPDTLYSVHWQRNPIPIGADCRSTPIMANFSHSLLLFLLSNLVSALNNCYYPNTKEAASDFPCDPDAENSPCCGGGSGAMCLSNKSCKGPAQNMIRGSCTDQSWRSLDCPLYCYLSTFSLPSLAPLQRPSASIEPANQGWDIAPNIGPDIISCGNVTNTDTSFCCDHTANCCNTGNGRFELLPSNPEPWATWDNTKSQFIVVKPLSTATTTSTSTTANTPTPTSTSARSSTTTTTSSPPPAQTAPGAITSDQAQSTGLSTGAQAGIGVGVSVSAVLLGVIAYLLWKLYQNQKGAKQPENQGQDTNQQYPTSPYHGQVTQPEMYAYPGELSAERPPMELGGIPRPQEPAELPGGAIWPLTKAR